MICPICSDISPSRFAQLMICKTCSLKVGNLASQRTLRVNSGDVHVGFLYKSIVRELMLQAKVKNSAIAVGLLVKLLADAMMDIVIKNNSSDHLVIAAPSSLRSRVYGRFDLAQALSLSLFPQAVRLSGPLPGALLRSKRAGRNRVLASPWRTKLLPLIPTYLKNFISLPREIKENNNIFAEISSGRPILVVDDVLTTGFTMGTLFDQLRVLGAQKFEGLVLAAPPIVLADHSSRPLAAGSKVLTDQSAQKQTHCEEDWPYDNRSLQTDPDAAAIL